MGPRPCDLRDDVRKWSRAHSAVSRGVTAQIIGLGTVVGGAALIAGIYRLVRRQKWFFKMFQWRSFGRSSLMATRVAGQTGRLTMHLSGRKVQVSCDRPAHCGRHFPRREGAFVGTMTDSSDPYAGSIQSHSLT